MTTAFDPVDLAGLPLANRIVMAPMTRNRATGGGGVPTDSMVAYYAQRAGAGLIVTEATQTAVVGQGYPFTPGLHTPAQVAGWRRVTDAVHEAGGRIFAQLWHGGRIGHPVLLPDGLIPVGPSPVAADGQVFTEDGLKDCVTPRELTDAEIHETVDGFAAAARNALEAGFDGVEIHGANGYLVHQFLAPNSNRRTDAWGGDAERRNRFAVAVTRAVAEAVGAHRTGLRLSPGNPFNGIDEPDPEAQYTALLQAVEPLGLAYLHVCDVPDRELLARLRKHFTGTFVLNPASGDRPTGLADLGLIEDGSADLLAFGRQFLANPDLPRRLALGGPFNTPDRASFYGGDDSGYLDYPALDD
ncbi:alkene reductase [Streptomyces gilvosporeus]|uniref:Alkene reductase n=1 Tax=Streptomyces gilvosporeus TaxID=553510 RepID=A0A1V0TP86_9ACTN|nr:alkene reductase [Streptomyces gilvosporeus]ARF54741.1 alkene reductase [Streptomyces gilvosporeus]